MRVTRRTILMRLMAIVLCLSAFGVYVTFAPAPSYAEATCTCGGGLDGKCDGNDLCVCFIENGACTRCVWDRNNSTCKPCLD
jgi:hypothetical protein